MGFTVIEVLVAILLLSTVILIGTGFILPLRVTQQTSIQTTALAYGRAYIELIKARWSESSSYTDAVTNLPTVSSDDADADSSDDADADIKMPTGWMLEDNRTAWAATDNIRTVTVIVKPPINPGESTSDWQRRWVEVSTLITRP